jgi:hypothetical protein
MKALRLVSFTMYDEADETLYERRRSSMEYIALDSHKRYSFASVEGHTGAILSDTTCAWKTFYAESPTMPSDTATTERNSWC